MSRISMTRTPRPGLGLLAALLAAFASPARAEAPAGASAAQESPNRLVRGGVVVEFSLEAPGAAPGAPVLEDEYAEVRFRITDATTGDPVRGLNPAAWVDVAGGLSGGAGGPADCREKVGLYLKGLVGIRPVADLNSYFLLVLNGDSSISVIDPMVSMTGRTSLYASVLLPRPGADWVRTRNQKRLFVSMPLAGQVAAVDTESFKLIESMAAGGAPTRLALQPDQRYLWVGNDSRKPGESGVTVLDAVALKPVVTIPTGRGHHEIAFSADSRQAFVTNRDDGTITVIDVARLEKVKELRVGSAPISLAFSPLSGFIYVADGKEGRVVVVDPATLSIVARIAAKPGLGPMRFSDDGRWGFVVNSTEHAVHVIDASRNQVVQTVPLAGKPYQVTFSRAFAYLRLLDSEKVNMVNLLSLGEGKPPIVTTFSAGNGAPRNAGDLSIADSIAPASTDAAVFVNNPVEGKTYYYMEGMNAPMGNFSAYGHKTVAVAVVDRSVKEVAPGTYAATLRLPEAGRYDVAFLIDNPKVLHCFAAEVKPNPLLASAPGAVHVEYLGLPSTAEPGRPIRLRLQLADPRGGAPRTGLRDVQVTWYKAPGLLRRAALARETEPGSYEVELSFAEPGAWYVQVTIPSLKAGPGDVPYRSLLVRGAPPPPAGDQASPR